MLGDADRVGEGDLGDRDALVHRRLQVGVVGADAGGDDHLQLLGLVEALLRHVGRPERLRDDDVRVGKLAVELAIGSVLVGRDDKGVTTILQESAKAELAGDASEQLARPEVDRLRCRQQLTVGIALDPRQIVARIVLGVAVYGVVVENAQDLRHGGAFRLPCGNGTRIRSRRSPAGGEDAVLPPSGAPGTADSLRRSRES